MFDWQNALIQKHFAAAKIYFLIMIECGIEQ